MNYARPGVSYELAFYGFDTALTGTCGYAIEDGLGNVVIARTTAGIVESPAGSGIYNVVIPATPDTAGQYAVIFDNGNAPLTPSDVAVEPLTVTSSVVTIAPEGDSVGGPTLGPCTSWIDGADVAACCSADPGSGDFETVALEASMALFEVSGRLFTGLCERNVRPCRQRCGCWGLPAGGHPGFWWGAVAGRWQNECGDTCGCQSLSRVKLAGYPVREIVEVKIDGNVVGADGYRLDGRRWLVRMDDPGPPVVQRRWPGCQNLALEDDQPGTFSVAYRSGVDPPELGRKAAAQLACEMFRSCQPGAECALPKGTTKVVRQGVTVERQLLQGLLDPKKPTGLVNVDLFLRAYGLPGGRRRPAVWSPDVERFARPAGS